jgi:hypothetical protein
MYRSTLASLTTHSTGRAISKPLIETLGGFGGPCAPVNSGVRRFLETFAELTDDVSRTERILAGLA